MHSLPGYDTWKTDFLEDYDDELAELQEIAAEEVANFESLCERIPAEDESEPALNAIDPFDAVALYGVAA